MPKKKLDACMFCTPDPCQCRGVAKPKKQSTPKKRPCPQDLSDLSESVPVAPPADEVDIKAAMKLASFKPTPVARQQARVAVIHEKKLDNSDLIEALVALEPILHPDEKRKWSEVLDRAGTRAERWRARRGKG